MTFPNKENLIFFEKLAETQLPLYKDACDYGIKMSRTVTNGTSLKAEARENLLALMGTYKYKIDRPKTARYPYDVDFKNTSKTELFIPFEKDDGRFVGVRLTVYFETFSNNHHFGSNGKAPAEILTIDISRHAQEENPYQPIKKSADQWAENARDAKRFN